MAELENMRSWLLSTCSVCSVVGVCRDGSLPSVQECLHFCMGLFYLKTVRVVYIPKVGTDQTEVKDVASWFPLCGCDKMPWSNVIWGGEGLSSLRFQVTICDG